MTQAEFREGVKDSRLEGHRLMVSGSSKFYFLLTCMHIGGVRTSEGNASVGCFEVIRAKYGSQSDCNHNCTDIFQEIVYIISDKF